MNFVDLIDVYQSASRKIDIVRPKSPMENFVKELYMNVAKVIAIDGPSGSGKSTVAKELAKKLGLLYIDTGAMFRALGYICLKNDVNLRDGPQIKEVLQRLEMKYAPSSEILIAINGVDLTQKIREHHISKQASIVSQIPEVREYLLDFQRALARERLCVMEGRDIGSVVFPNAFAKFFITASDEVRAQRRLDQLREQGDDQVTKNEVLEAIRTRDQSDINRAMAPLVQAVDAEKIDTSDMDIEKVLDKMGRSVVARALKVGIDL